MHLTSPGERRHRARGAGDGWRAAGSAGSARSVSWAIAAFALAVVIATLPLALVAGAVPIVGSPWDGASVERVLANDDANGAAVDVRSVRLVVNDDGSATVSATLRNPTDTGRTLVGVRVDCGDRPLPVASTIMLLLVMSRSSARVGDASDAGGYVVPVGVAMDDPVTVRFAFDDGTSSTRSAEVVRRSGEHDQVFPDNGAQLGPARAPSSLDLLPFVTAR